MLNVVTIGTSFITDLFLQAVEQLEGIRCTGMYTRTRDHALALAQRHGVSAIYTDLDEMLAADADIVYIASPNALHAEHAEKALRAGKHVICEKPFTMTSAQARALFQLAEQKQRFLFEAIVTQHMPNYHAIRDLLPRIGKIKVVQSNFSQYSSRYAQYLSGSVPNVFSPQWGGGALADIGIYCIHFIVGLFNEPKEVHYFPNRGYNGIDTSGCGILTYPDFIASFTCAKDSRSECITQIQGDAGCITLHGEASRCTRFVLQDAEGTIHEDLAQPQHDNVMVHELKEFTRILTENDSAAYAALKQESLAVMRTFEALRAHGNVPWPNGD